MKTVGDYTLFGYFEGAPYDYVTDTLADFEHLQNDLPRQVIIDHIQDLTPAISSARGKDAYSGDVYQAAQYDDGHFVFPIDVLRYLKQGKIGVPKEYEEYITRTV